MDASDYNLIELLDRIYLNEYCCPMPRKWAELSNHVCSTVDHAKPQIRYPPSLILAAWSESSDVEKRQRLFEQLLFAYRHGTIDQAHDYLMSLHDSDWHKMRG
jgi:hypothetical protein